MKFQILEDFWRTSCNSIHLTGHNCKESKLARFRVSVSGISFSLPGPARRSPVSFDRPIDRDSESLEQAEKELLG